MKNLFNNLTSEEKKAILEQHKITKFVISEQAQGVLQTSGAPQTTTGTSQQSLMNENAVKSCLDATYNKRNLGKTPKGGLTYNTGGLVTVFYLNGRYIQEYTKQKGFFNCTTGKAVLTPDTQATKPTTKPVVKPSTKPATSTKANPAPQPQQVSPTTK